MGSSQPIRIRVFRFRSGNFNNNVKCFQGFILIQGVLDYLQSNMPYSSSFINYIPSLSRVTYFFSIFRCISQYNSFQLNTFHSSYHQTIVSKQIFTMYTQSLNLFQTWYPKYHVFKSLDSRNLSTDHRLVIDNKLLQQPIMQLVHGNVQSTQSHLRAYMWMRLNAKPNVFHT